MKPKREERGKGEAEEAWALEKQGNETEKRSRRRRKRTRRGRRSLGVRKTRE